MDVRLLLWSASLLTKLNVAVGWCCYSSEVADLPVVPFVDSVVAH